MADWTARTDANVGREVASTTQPLCAVSVTLTFVRVRPPVFVSVVVVVAEAPGVAIGAVLSVNGCRTTIGADPVTPPTVALMAATPSPIAFTNPVGLTVATEVSLLRYRTLPFVRLTNDSSV